MSLGGDQQSEMRSEREVSAPARDAARHSADASDMPVPLCSVAAVTACSHI